VLVDDSIIAKITTGGISPWLGMKPASGSPPTLAHTQRDDFVKWELLIQDQKILPQ
jgi:hypothetical protein